jgi:hypothetical protein
MWNVLEWVRLCVNGFNARVQPKNMNGKHSNCNHRNRNSAINNTDPNINININTAN